MNLIQINIITNTGFKHTFKIDINDIPTYEDLLYFLLKTYEHTKVEKLSILLSEVYINSKSNEQQEIFPLHEKKEFYQSILERFNNNFEINVIINEEKLDSTSDKINSEKFIHLFIKINKFKEIIENDLKFGSFINNLSVFKRCSQSFNIFESDMKELLSKTFYNKELKKILVNYFNIVGLLSILTD